MSDSAHLRPFVVRYSGKRATFHLCSPLEAVLSYLRNHNGMQEGDVLAVVAGDNEDQLPTFYVVQGGQFTGEWTCEPVPLPEDGPPREQIPVSPVTFLEAALDRKRRADERRYLAGPLIFAGLWSDTVPEWLRAAIPKARVMQLLVEGGAGVQEHDRMCTLEEVAAYLYTASLEFPLASEWVRVYFWASNQVMQAHGKLPEGQTIWGIIDPNGDLGADRRELNDYERREHLDKLRRDIRRAVVKHQKKREKAARRAC